MGLLVNLNQALREVSIVCGMGTSLHMTAIDWIVAGRIDVSGLLIQINKYTGGGKSKTHT